MQDLARFLQIRQMLQDLYKLGKSCKILAKTCKNAIASKNLARIEFFVRILKDFPNWQETGKILQEINFL